MNNLTTQGMRKGEGTDGHRKAGEGREDLKCRTTDKWDLVEDRTKRSKVIGVWQHDLP